MGTTPEPIDPSHLHVPLPRAGSGIPGARVLWAILGVILFGAGVRALAVETDANGAISIVVGGILAFVRAFFPARRQDDGHDSAVTFDPERSEIRIERSNGSFISVPRSTIVGVDIETSGASSNSSSPTTHRVVLHKSDRPTLAHLTIGPSYGTGPEVEKLRRKVALALLLAPPRPEVEPALVDEAWLRLAHNPRVRATGTPPSEHWDPAWGHVEMRLRPVPDHLAAVRAAIFRGGGLAMLTGFVLGFNIKARHDLPLVALVTFGVLVTASAIFAVLATRKQNSHHRLRLDANNLTLNRFVGQHETSRREWPIQRVDAIDTYREPNASTARLALRLAGETDAFERRVKQVEDGGFGPLALGGLVSDVGFGGIFGRKLGYSEFSPDVANDIEVILDAAIARAKESSARVAPE